MELRKEIEPRMDIAESCYPQVLKIIQDYEKYVDENGDEDNVEYERIERVLQEMTGKDMAGYNLYETWEGEGAEVTAFRISLPDPLLVEDITHEELYEIIRRAKSTGYPTGEEETFGELFANYLDAYYHSFLKLNFKKYNYNYFIRQKDNSYLAVEEIADKIR